MTIGKIPAQTFSYALHPLLMTFYCVGLLFTYTTFYEIYYRSIFIILFTIIIFSVVIPCTFVILLKKLGFIEKISSITRREKVLPYFMVVFSNCMMIYYFYYTANMSFWFLGLLAAPTLSLLIGAIINLFWKISAHMIGMGSLIGSTFSICANVKGLNPFVLFIILFILAGCLGVSRLYLKQNTPAQVYAGFILGITVSFLTVWGSLIIVLSKWI